MDHIVRRAASLVVMLLSAVGCNFGLRIPTAVPDSVERSVLIGPPDEGYVEIAGAFEVFVKGAPFVFPGDLAMFIQSALPE